MFISLAGDYMSGISFPIKENLERSLVPLPHKATAVYKQETVLTRPYLHWYLGLALLGLQNCKQ